MSFRKMEGISMPGRGPVSALVCVLFYLAVPADAQFPSVRIRVKYICPKEGRSWQSSNGGEKHYCWDGKHYSKSTGGVPAFILEYWAEQERKSAEFSAEMARSREEAMARRAADEAAADEARLKMGLPSLAEARRASAERHRAAVEAAQARTRSRLSVAGAATVEQSQKPAHEPLPTDRFSRFTAGTDRAVIVEALGQPHGSMSNLGADGDEESLTYLVEGGGHASIRLKQGKLLTVRLP
jgi:hypothetical protein